MQANDFNEEEATAEADLDDFGTIDLNAENFDFDFGAGDFQTFWKAFFVFFLFLTCNS